MDTYTWYWYQSLIKPSWAPPADVFSPAWALLYTIIAFSFGYVFYKAYKGELPTKVALIFLLNLCFNFAFPVVQFELQNNLLASLDILLVLGTLVWAMVSIYRYAAWVAMVNVPYLLWVSFATVLQFTVTYLNF
jgi:translocator protein